MDYFFQEQRWTDTFLSLYVKKIKRIILFLLIAFSAAGTKAQSDVKFNDYVRYSQWVIDSRLGDFYGNTNDFGFTTYNRNLSVKKEVTKWKKGSANPGIDYVAGLVAKATIEAADYYKAFNWAKPWFKSVEWYGNKCNVSTTPDNLDAINASKMYFGIYALANGSFSSNAESTTASKATTQLGNALTALGNYSKEYKSDGSGGYAFPANTTVTRDSKSVSLDGGWFHKKDYLKEMWLDGQYMGPATLAQLKGEYSSYEDITTDDWALITKQFSIVWDMCWDETEQLLYHAFCSEARSNTWAGSAEIWTTAQTNTSSWQGMTAAGHSAAFWGRAEGWYFLALVDVLEQMKNAGLSASTNPNNSCYTTLKGYLDQLALGIAKRQDATSGCWYQLIGKDGEYSARYYNGADKGVKQNYLESSCTAIFAAAFLKATRLELLSSASDGTTTYNYKEIGTNAYKGAVDQFMKQLSDNTVHLLGCCKSAGVGTDALGADKFRDGSNAYYLHGYDVAPTSTTSNYYTEGKVMGAFIMAATEYERVNEKPIRFSYDLAPTYTLTKGQSLKVEALGSGAGTASYQWYNASGDSKVSDATSSTFAPTESGSYYCEAKSGTTTIKTSTANVTLKEAVVSSDIFSLTVTYNQVYNLASGSDLNLTSEYATVTGGTALVHNGHDKNAADIIYLKNNSGNIALNGSGGTYTKLTLNTPLQVGDVITFTSDENSIGSFYLTSSATKNEYCPVTSGTYTITATDGLAGANTATDGLAGANAKDIYVWNKSSGKFKSITISRKVSITNQPTVATYDVNAANVNGLKFEVSATGVKEFSYQWYSNTTNSTVGGREITTNGKSNTYTPVVTTAGTTYYYCIATAGVLSVTSDVVAVAVLNPSDLKTNYNAAWTPIANGTIDVSNLVTSSSKGAYSITTGNSDVATISGTTITALKAGKFTLSQEADDKYKAGSKEITVRIGTNVTSDGTNKYSFTAEKTDVSDGMTITRKDITMTFGNDGFWSQPSANGYTGGQRNPKDSDGKDPSAGKIPSIGTFYKFKPTKAGTLAIKVKLNSSNGKLRPLYVSENGTLIKAKYKAGTELDPANMPAATEPYVGNITFTVKANTDYYVYVNSSKLGFYNFEFTPDQTFTVTFITGSNGTCATTSIEQSSKGESITLPDVTPADGYTFDGWYTDDKFTSKVNGTTYTPSAPTTLYAKWIPITDLFSLTGVTSTTKSVASKTAYDVTSDDATVTGGSAQLYNGHDSSAGNMITDSQINLNGSGGSYLKITLDNTLKAGDEIIINPSTSSFKLSATNSNSDAKSFTGSYVIQGSDAVVGKNVIYIYRDTKSFIQDINITRSYPESDSRATFTYNGTAIAFSEKTAGDKSAYTTTLEIGAHKKGEAITITPTVKEGASIKQGETAVNGNITITVPSTIGGTATSTYTVTSKDETSTTTYEIIVKLVKDNVVLVFSNGSTEWTWDKTTNQTQPTFTQPTLKAYLAETYGKENVTPKEVTISSNIKYLSDVTDVATVVETTGEITIKSDANGGAKIYAILEGHTDYNDAQTFFNILVKQGYSYSVAGDASIEKGPSLNTPVYIKKGEENLVKMTFGGWKWKNYTDKNDNNKVKSTYVVNGSNKTDSWNALDSQKESDIASIDGYSKYISGAEDAVDEKKEASDKTIYGSTRYGWFKPAKERNDGYLETYPYTLPVRGAYMTFEPTQNGTLTVYILQNGAWNTNRSGSYEGISFKDGEIVAGEFRPHSFYICNQRGLTVDQFSPKTFNVTTKQSVKGQYYCNLTNNQEDPKNIATWKEFKDYMSKAEQDSVAKNWKNGINGAQKIVKLDNGSYLAIQKGIVKYTFFVTANETYYLFSNFSKLGFCGANFVPSTTVVPADDEAHKIELSDVEAYPTITPPAASAEGEEKYKYKFGKTVKGYVEGFTIPLFKSIKLSRTFKPNQWTTLTLPFNLTQTEVEQIFGKGTQIIVFDKAEPTSARIYLTFFYHEIQNVLPGYPYLIRPTLEYDNNNSSSADNAPIHTITNGNLTEFTVYNKAINPAIKPHEFKSGNYTAMGTPSYCTANVSGNGKTNYSKRYKNGDIFVSENNGTVYISEGNSYGKGYRSYIDYTGTTTPPSAKALSISFSGVEDGDDNGTTTDIRIAELADDVIQTLGIGGVYNLNGQKVADTTRNLPAGIYIVNGRKVVVK